MRTKAVMSLLCYYFLLFTVLALTLTGCAQFSSLKGAIADRGAAVSDEARDTAEFVLCRGITVGAWLRAYGNEPEKAKAWQRCAVLSFRHHQRNNNGNQG